MPITEIENLKKAILQDYPRMGEEDVFQFACHPGVSCFNQCCSDINIFLTPYDIMRLRNRLKITSDEFLDNYTLIPIDENQNYPVILLKMRYDAEKKCHFVEAGGCTVYSDRPWSCRMYPVGLASPKEGEVEQEFYFLMKEEVCKGFVEGKKWTIRQWKADQGVEKYDEFGRLFKEITLHDYFASGKKLDPAKMEMFHMVCYNLDKFRAFLFGTTFFQRFEIEEGLQEKLAKEDEELLRFGFRWLKFALFGEKTIGIKPDVKKKVLDAR
jgi:Fe-S-cluster containining protein